MDPRGRDTCCHGYERPKTSHRAYRYESSSICNREPIRTMASVGLQTDTPFPKSLSRAKSTNAICQEVPKDNNFYQRFRSSSRQREKPCLSNLQSETPIFKGLPLKGFPVYRTGRMGSCWRHLRRVTGPNGENIMYIDGTVKEADCDSFPPHGFPVLKVSSNQSQLNRRPKTSYHHRHESPRICPTSTSLDYHDYRFTSPDQQSTTSMSDRTDHYKTRDKTKHLHIHLQLCPHDLKRAG